MAVSDGTARFYDDFVCFINFGFANLLSLQRMYNPQKW